MSLHDNFVEVSKEDFGKSEIAKFILPETSKRSDIAKTRLGFSKDKTKIGKGTFG